MRKCENCSAEISVHRLEILPHATTCVLCSSEKKKVGFMDWYHKTAPELVVVSAENKEDLRRAIRVNARSR